MAFQTRDEAQDKFSKKVDKNLFKKTKQKPLGEESWADLSQRGATLAEQFEWIKINRRKNDNSRSTEA